MKHKTKKLVNDIIYLILKDIQTNGINESLKTIEIDSNIKITYLLTNENNDINPFDNALFQIKAKIEKNNNLIIAFYYRDFKNKVEEINFTDYLIDLDNKKSIEIFFSYNGKYELINDNTKNEPITNEIKTLINKKKTI